jgi:hypothetical protein
MNKELIELLEGFRKFTEDEDVNKFGKGILKLFQEVIQTVETGEDIDPEKAVDIFLHLNSQDEIEIPRGLLVSLVDRIEFFRGNPNSEENEALKKENEELRQRLMYLGERLASGYAVLARSHDGIPFTFCGAFDRHKEAHAHAESLVRLESPNRVEWREGFDALVRGRSWIHRDGFEVRIVDADVYKRHCDPEGEHKRYLEEECEEDPTSDKKPSVDATEA